MSKTVVEYTARRITYETSLPIDEVIARLERKINKQGGGPEVFRVLRTSKSRAELESAFESLTAGGDFVYVSRLLVVRSRRRADVVRTAATLWTQPTTTGSMRTWDRP